MLATRACPGLYLLYFVSAFYAYALVASFPPVPILRCQAGDRPDVIKTPS